MQRLIKLAVNGETYEVIIEPRRTLLEVLRDTLGLPGTKKACYSDKTAVPVPLSWTVNQ